MTRPVHISSLWQSAWPDLYPALDRAIHKGMQATTHTACVYFRADDIAVPGQRNTALFRVFEQHGTPLCAAVVPAWLTEKRWQHLQSLTAQSPHLWAWHQHGWRHVNHEPASRRKCECGNAREKAVVRDIQQGADRLRRMLGKSFVPVFTPPWNRMSCQALAALAPAGLVAVSRADTTRPPCPANCPDFPVHLDLHTRRAPCPHTDRQNLLDELTTGLAQGSLGIMLHHQRMNRHALHFLDTLLPLLARHARIRTVHFAHLLEEAASQ